MTEFTIVRHEAEAEARQDPSPDEWWQDSIFVTWHDPDAGVGGHCRIGHEPNYQGGKVALWFGLVASDGTRFRRNTYTSLTDADRPGDGFGALGGRYEMTYEDGFRLRADDDECKADLLVSDFYPRTDFFARDGGVLSEQIAGKHFETSGRITGWVELDGRRYEVDGLCHRNRSSGTRHWDTILNHRWMPVTFGPDLSLGAIGWHSSDGSIIQQGYVVRDGEVIRASSVDMVLADGGRRRQLPWRHDDVDASRRRVDRARVRDRGRRAV